jgi:uncharacterized protein (TIGR03437 family)
MTTVAGGGVPDNLPGTATGLGYVSGLTVDSSGNLFLVIQGLILKLNLSTGLLTRVAGKGTLGFSGDSGPATNAQLSVGDVAVPGIAVGASGDVYFVDFGNRRVRKVSGGVITTVAGNGNDTFSGDGGLAINAGIYPFDIALDSSGNVYIADSGRIRKVSNGVITTIVGPAASTGGGDNNPTVIAQLGGVTSIALDKNGDLYIADRDNYCVRKVSNGVITTVAGGGNQSSDNVSALNARFWPTDIAVDSSGNLYISDGLSSTTKKVSGGVITTVTGVWTGPLAVDPQGNLFLGSPLAKPPTPGGSVVREVSAKGVVTTVAGNGNGRFIGDDGPATNAVLGSPSGIAVDRLNDIYIADAEDNAVRRVANGIISAFAGNEEGGGGCASNGDNGPATNAEIAGLSSLALDSVGNLFITQCSGIREVSGGIIATVPGTVSNPTGVAVDSAGGVYVSDSIFNSIQKIVGGIATTVAGTSNPGFGGDGGPATDALLDSPTGITIDSSGNLYIADTGNNRVRRVSNGIITTVAGNGTAGFCGDNGLATDARLSAPYGVAVDSSGSLYIADTGNHRIRRVSNGMITTIAGNGIAGFDADDNGPAAASALNSPKSVAVDTAGSIYIADTRNNRVRALTSVGVPTAFINRNSASYAPGNLAPSMIAFGEAPGIVQELVVASSDPWPTHLAGVSIDITDSQSQHWSAPIYFVAPNSVGYLVPAGIALGPATFHLTASGGISFSDTAIIGAISPGLYTANSGGSGVAAGTWLKVAVDGTRSQGYLFDPNTLGAAQVDLGITSDAVYLSLYGTGFRGNSGQIRATIGGLPLQVLGAAATQYPGEDMVNLGPIPQSLAGACELTVVLTFDGKQANPITVALR